jgi:hypothetical protein
MYQSDVVATMVSLRRRLDNGGDGERERQFFSHALQYLTTASGRQVEIQTWMITSLEVEFGPQIGSGGLYVLHLLWSVFLPANFKFMTADRYSRELGMKPKLL